MSSEHKPEVYDLSEHLDNLYTNGKIFFSDEEGNSMGPINTCSRDVAHEIFTHIGDIITSQWLATEDAINNFRPKMDELVKHLCSVRVIVVDNRVAAVALESDEGKEISN